MSEEIVTVNPYLFILLLRMLYYEYVGLQLKLPSNRAMGRLIYDNIKRKDLEKDEIDEYAEAIAEFIRHEMLPLKKNKFDKYRLNLVAMQINKLGQYIDWDDFVQNFKKDRGYIFSADYMYADINELPEKEKERIMFWVASRINDLHKTYEINYGKDQQTIIESNSEYIIRTLNLNEVWELGSRRPQSTNRHWIESKDFEQIYIKNKNVLFILKNSFGVIGYICILPLKSFAYEELMDGSLSFINIKAHHIHGVSERKLVAHIFIHVFEQRQNLFFKNIVKYFGRIAKSLTEKEYVKVIAIAKTNVCRTLAVRAGLVKIGETKPAENIVKNENFWLQKYSIYEKVVDLTIRSNQN